MSLPAGAVMLLLITLVLSAAKKRMPLLLLPVESAFMMLFISVLLSAWFT